MNRAFRAFHASSNSWGVAPGSSDTVPLALNSTVQVAQLRCTSLERDTRKCAVYGVPLKTERTDRDFQSSEPTMDPIKNIKLRWLHGALHDVSYELSRSQFSRFAHAWEPAINAYRCKTCIRICVDLENCERSEEHTSELQSRLHLVCRLLLEKKKIEAISTRYLRSW